jgi:DNA-binding XRE family transcriptional regulator
MMRGMVAVDDVIASFPKKRRAAIEKRGNALLAKVARRMTLKEIRKERKITQAQMADALGIGQMQISRLEQRRDPRLSTMHKTVEALGGNLMLLATFPDQEPVVLVTTATTKKPKSTGQKKDIRRMSRSTISELR